MCKFWCNRKSKQKQLVFKSHGHVSSRNCFFLLHQQLWCECCWCHFHFECFVFAEIMIQQKSKCRENSENAPPSASCGFTCPKRWAVSRLQTESPDSLWLEQTFRITAQLPEHLCGRRSNVNQATQHSLRIYLDVCLNIPTAHPLRSPPLLPPLF